MVRRIDAAAMEVYLAYRRYESDDITVVDFLVDNGVVVGHGIKIGVVMTGARINFQAAAVPPWSPPNPS